MDMWNVAFEKNILKIMNHPSVTLLVWFLITIESDKEIPWLKNGGWHLSKSSMDISSNYWR